LQKSNIYSDAASLRQTLSKWSKSKRICEKNMCLENN